MTALAFEVAVDPRDAAKDALELFLDGVRALTVGWWGPVVLLGWLLDLPARFFRSVQARKAQR